MKAITKQEKKNWTRAKVLKTSKQRWDSLGMVCNGELYLHLKRMFLHTDIYTMIRFNSFDTNMLREILSQLDINYTIEDDRFILDLDAWYDN